MLHTAHEMETTLLQRWYLIFKHIMLKVVIKGHTILIYNHYRFKFVIFNTVVIICAVQIKN